jgi:hypothetical protein
LRIKDIKFHLTEEGKQYAIVRIPEDKTVPRTVPLVDSREFSIEMDIGSDGSQFV